MKGDEVHGRVVGLSADTDLLGGVKRESAGTDTMSGREAWGGGQIEWSVPRAMWPASGRRLEEGTWSTQELS